MFLPGKKSKERCCFQSHVLTPVLSHVSFCLYGSSTKRTSLVQCGHFKPFLHLIYKTTYFLSHEKQQLSLILQKRWMCQSLAASNGSMNEFEFLSVFPTKAANKRWDFNDHLSGTYSTDNGRPEWSFRERPLWLFTNTHLLRHRSQNQWCSNYKW